MKKTTLKENRIWRVPQFEVELHHAGYVTHSFPKHTHDQYAIGVIERGALGFYYRGENVVASAGDINLCIPGEAHTGQAAAEDGWVYRMFYFSPQVLKSVAAEVADRPHDLPFFRTGVIHDRPLARQIHHLHRLFDKQDTPMIEQESALLNVLAHLVNRHADATPPEGRLRHAPGAVALAKQFIDENFTDDIALEQLAQLTNLSRYHLVHIFGQSVGVPPHSYLRQVRIKHAKILLASGGKIADVAAATGFVDQSHLTRWFKRYWGYTPGQYRNSVQDRSAYTS